MRQHSCLRSFPVPMLQLRCQWWGKLLTQVYPVRPAQVIWEPQLRMKQRRCPPLEIVAEHFRTAREIPRHPRWEKAPDFVEGPTRP